MIESKNIIESIYALLEEVPDPEVPVLSIIDLGIVRAVELINGQPRISITPTYVGCPAMDHIKMEIRLKLLENNFTAPDVVNVLSPAWTTDWMTEAGKEKLRAYGIAPPNQKQQVCRQDFFTPDEAVQCPRCESYNTQLVSNFGSTACKALYKCLHCLEPFDYFKCH